ncbi:MAG: sugar transporter substrate-binding protein [Clostridiales bacterium]|jgi:D-xylose transport system substrate-binding protein|nr:sugar transporter substrate-binding protein [Clostridiales bacterium]
MKNGNQKLSMSSILVFLLIIVTLSSCTKNNDNRNNGKDSKLLIGFSLATFKEDRWLRDRDIFVAKANEAGYEVIVTNANNDKDLQYEQVRDMVERGIDILVIAPHDADDAARAVELAKKEDIPVISYDRLIRNSDVDAYISFDNVKVGSLLAKGIISEMPEGGYIVLNGSEDDNNSIMFNEGYMKELKPYVENGKISIVAETWVDNWTRETAYEFVSSAIKGNPGKVNAIIAANDSLAWGTIDALSEARLTGEILVGGHDADLAACQRIVSGTQLLTIYKPIKNLVEETIYVCEELLNDKKLDYELTINDGTYNIPYVMIDVIAVTKDNIDDTVIKDGFHLKEDVYREDAD